VSLQSRKTWVSAGLRPTPGSQADGAGERLLRCDRRYRLQVNVESAQNRLRRWAEQAAQDAPQVAGVYANAAAALGCADALRMLRDAGGRLDVMEGQAAMRPR
jgi:hypothetical protein